MDGHSKAERSAQAELFKQNLKKCFTCKLIKSTNEFQNVGDHKDGLSSTCKACLNQKLVEKRRTHREEVRKYEREWYRKHPASPDKTRAKHLQQRYLTTPEQYEEMYKSQGGLCAICKKPFPKLGVDHDHNTRKIRGLLCFACNFILGLCKDKPYILQSAITYLQEASKK